MTYTVHAPQTLDADITLPSSKSISNRALILHALAAGDHVPFRLSDCDDTFVMVRALTQNPKTVDIMAAGTAMRFLTAYYSVTPGEHIITGTERMKHRPISILVNALQSLGAQIAYVDEEGFPPLHIVGSQLRGDHVTLSGDVSSQYISALLMIGATLPNGLTLNLTGEIVSRPYIQLTLELMKEYGSKAEWISKNCIHVYAGGYQDVPFEVESDWSAASYWYEIMALSQGRCVHLKGLHEKSYQGDSMGAKVFEKLGITTTFDDEGALLTKNNSCTEYLEEDFLTIPDLTQTFVVTCCLKGVKFRFHGLRSLRIKETDRISALITELKKLGYVLHAEGDETLYWDGERTDATPNAIIATYEDHRMAMAFAPASLVLPQIKIAHPQVVSKSYPHFWEDLTQAGFIIRESN